MTHNTGVAPPAVRAALPGTCGELVQGTLDGMHCLVSCPIARYSVAEVRLDAGASWRVQPELPKVREALHYGLAFLHRTDSSGQVRLSSDIPHGRGYGSSTADIGATLSALGHAWGHPMTPEDISRLALRVEPTDSSLFPGLTLWDHRQGQRCEAWGQPPTMMVVVLDPGGEVDTIAYNQHDHRTHLRALAAPHRDAFQLLREGLEQGDPSAIGAAATLSAKAHQAILPNPLLETALRLAQDVEACGVCRAHSGTILGLLLDPTRTDVAHVQALATQRLTQGISIYSVPIVEGGPRLRGPEVTDRWR